MRKLLLAISVVVVALLTALNANPTFASQPEATHGNPYHRTTAAAQTSSTPFGGIGNLVYHTGGSVQTGTHHTYAIYWGSDFAYNGVSGTAANGYQTLVNGYFGNVAADSSKTSNVYYSDTQYYQNIGGLKTFIQYSEQFGGTWNDPTLPASDCSSTAGGSLCVSDAAVQAEVKKAIAANGWPKGLGAEYFVFLANNISTCLDASHCAFSYFCAYHSNYADGTQNVLYANMPFTGHSVSTCSSAKGSPNNNAAADATISTTSHEANETITDALGNAWYDLRGYENGDKCAYNYGTRLGTVNGGDYNQAIGSGKYEMQQEWSNAHRGCVLINK